MAKREGGTTALRLRGGIPGLMSLPERNEEMEPHLSMLPHPVLKERIARLIEAIEGNPKFNMCQYFYLDNGDDPYVCGSPSCIAGHAFVLANPDSFDFDSMQPSSQELATAALAEWLGIPLEDAEFMADPGQEMIARASKQDVVDMLNRLLADGAVVWRSGPYQCVRPDQLVSVH